MNELKNCPFCGSNEVDLLVDETKYSKTAYVECVLCGASSRVFYCQTSMIYLQDAIETQAIKAWNMRAQDAKSDN